MSGEGDDEFRESLGGVEGIPLPSQAVVTTQFRGMDTAQLKLMPDLGSLKQPTCRMLRKKMQIFEKACPGPRATCRHRSSTHDAELSGKQRFPVSANRNRKLRSESFFLSPLLPTDQFDVVHQHLDLQQKAAHQLLWTACPESSCSCFLSACWILWIHSDSGNFSFRERVPRLLRFPFRHLHEIPQLVRCHHRWVLHLDSEFSLDLRAHCSTILVSRLLSIVHIVGLC